MPSRIHTAGPAEHLVQSHFLMCTGQRVDEDEAIERSYALRGQQLGSGDIKKVTPEVFANRSSVGRFDLANCNRINCSGDRVRIIEIHGTIETDHIECGAVEGFTLLGIPYQGTVKLTALWFVSASSAICDAQAIPFF